MARTPTSNSHPWRKIIVLLVVLAIAVGGMALQKLWTPKLGLDLVGGTSILLRADVEGGGTPSSDQMAEAVNIIRNRVADIAEVEVNTQGDRYVLIEVPGATPKKTRDMVGQTAELRFRQVLGMLPNTPPAEQPGGGNQQGGEGDQNSQGDQSDGQNDADSSQEQDNAEDTGNAGDGNADDAGNDGDADGESAGQDSSNSGQDQDDSANRNRAVTDAVTAQDSDGKNSGKNGSDGPDSGNQGKKGSGSDGPEIAQAGASQQQMTELQNFKCKDTENQTDRADEPLYTCDREGDYKYILGPALIQGTNLTDASAGIPQQTAQWVVQLELDNEGKNRFAEASRSMYTLQQPLNQFAIVLDSEVISAPQINEPIPGGQASIEGNFNETEAQDLAQVLKYGSLPLSFHEDEVSQVSPTLGSDQLRLGLIAGGIGMILVLIYALLYYRALGFVVMFSLVIAAGVTYVAAVWLGEGQGFTLTLAGVAGLIVAIGITADSFVVFFERIRDEMREGKTPRAAVEAAWDRAKRTILISDAVSMIAAVVLYLLSVGGVRSFAYALGLTTVVDVIVVFLFTKPLTTLLVRTKFFGRGHSLSGLNASKIGIRKRNAYRVSSTQPAIEEH